jgi:hypothetical protein
MTRFGLLALLAVLSLAACNGREVIGEQDPTNSADVGEIRAALTGAVTDVAVLHSPFPGLSDAQLAPIIAAAMPTGFLASGTFTGDPAQATGRRYRIVWDFAAGNNYGTDGGCNTPPVPPAPAAAAAGGVARVSGTITLCRDGGPFTRVYGSVDQVAGPSDGNFQSYVRNMAHEILLYPMPIGGPGGGESRGP